MIESSERDAGRLPSDKQLLLLKAVLLSGLPARRAATTWLAGADIDRLDQASLRLLPLFYDRLREEGIDHPMLPVLKGIKKRAWYLNGRLLRRAGEAVRFLSEAGIEAMALKGMALTLAYYRDDGLRPMGDVDLMVHYQDAPAAMEVLYRHGWRSSDRKGAPAVFIALALKYQHAHHLLYPTGEVLDLHWNLLHVCPGPDADRDFWAASMEAELDAHTVRILHPADQLLHICEHGADWSPVSPIRWIPDALAVLRATPHFDWERLLSQARKRRLTLMIGGALDYLERNFGDCIPGSVLSEFHRTRTSVFERYEYNQFRKPATRFLGLTQRRLCKLKRVAEGKSLASVALRFPEYMCWKCNVRRKRELPMVLLRKAVDRMSKRPSR